VSIREAAAFAYGLYRRQAELAWHGHVRRDPTSRLQLRSGREDPYRLYEDLRRPGTLVATWDGNFVTTSHRVCNLVLRDRRFGVRDHDADHDEGGAMSLLGIDPPDHTRLRRLAQPAFSPRLIESYRPRVHRVVDELIDRFTADVDLVADFAAPMPIAVITDLLGVLDADAARFARLGAVFGSALGGIRSLPHAARLQSAQLELQGIFENLFELRRRRPADDVVSMLVAAEGDQIRPAEMVPMCGLLLVAGFETAVNLVGNATKALLDRPSQWADLCADPSLAANAIEETLRWDPPIQCTGRRAHEDVVIDGVEVRRGQTIVLLIGAANRDETVFPDGRNFDLHRTQVADHLAFSSGIHYCLGASLARMEATVALQRLVTRVPGLRQAGAVKRRNSSVVRGPLSFPVRVPEKAVSAA
jgi:cytochrome P450